MTKHSDESCARPPEAVGSNMPVGSKVRYVGFESIDSGRRLRFQVKSKLHGSVDVTFDVADALFINRRGISIQDVAPLAYEKLVELLAAETWLESDNFRLTDVDVERYLDRHMTSQKRASSSNEDRHRPDIAA